MTQARMIALLLPSLSLLAGCGPIVLQQQSTLATGMSFTFNTTPAGSPIPAQVAYVEFEFPVDWPSIKSLQEDVREITSSLSETPVTLKGVQLNRFVVTATAGDFGSLEDMGVSVTLPNGSAIDTKGAIGNDKASLVLTVQNKIDILDEIQTLESTDTKVKVRLSLHGVMPDPNPVFDVAAQGYVSASVLLPGLIVDVPVNIPVAKGQSVEQTPLANPGDPIPPELANVGYGIDVDWPTVKAFETNILGAAGVGFLSEFLHIDSLVPDSLELVCTEGDFSSLDKIAFVLTLPDGTEIDADGQISDDKKSMVLPTDSAVDLMSLLRKFGGTQRSVAFKIIAEGTIPPSDAVFDVKLNSTATIGIYYRT